MTRRHETAAEVAVDSGVVRRGTSRAPETPDGLVSDSCVTVGTLGLMAGRTIGFRPNSEDARILEDAAAEGESTTVTIRRALRLLDHEKWLDQARRDAVRMREENLNDEPDAW